MPLKEIEADNMTLEYSTKNRSQLIIPAIIISVAILLSTVIYTTTTFLLTPQFEITEKYLIDHKSNKVYYMRERMLFPLYEPYEDD